MTIGKSEVLCIYGMQLARFKSLSDAFRATRTEVHAALVAASPPPKADDVVGKAAPPIALGSLGGVARQAAKHGTPLVEVAVDPVDDHHHAHQAAHNADLWLRADQLIANAGITEGGVR